MGTGEALAVLGLAPGVTFGEVRAAYRQLVRRAHPDVAGPDGTAEAARLTQAYAVLRAEAAALRPDAALDPDVVLGPGDRAPGAPVTEAPTQDRRTTTGRRAAREHSAREPSAREHSAGAPPAAWRTAYDEAVEAELAAGDTLLLRAPPDEAFAALLEAAGHVGDVAYVDRQLGIVEAIVRFEGGPSCSLLVTLQGRVDGTEAFCTLESLEATPAPPLRPVVEALVAALGHPA